MSGKPRVPSIEEKRTEVERAQALVSRLSIELGQAVRERDRALEELRRMQATNPARVVNIPKRVGG
jgi:dihydroorotase-like cyclic amidohydrolase